MAASDQILDARPKRRPPTRQRAIMRVLGEMHALDLRVVEFGADHPGIGAHPLLAAGCLQKLAVEIDIPVPVEPMFRENAIERRAVHFLGFCKRAVDVEDESFHDVSEIPAIILERASGSPISRRYLCRFGLGTQWRIPP